MPGAKLVLFFAAYFFLSIILSSAPLNDAGQALAKVRSSGKNTVEPSKENLALGIKKYKDNDIDGAIDAFLQAIYFNRSSYNPQAYYWLGLCYQDKKLDAKAIEALKKSVEQSIKPCPQAHIHLAQLYLRNSRLSEAEFEGNKALIDYQGPGPDAHNILGLIAEKKDELGYANDQFRDALGDPPWHYTEAWMNLAENMIKQKQWGPAVIQLRNMLNHPKPLKGLDPQRIYLDIGICLLAKGDHQGAIDNWHEVLNYNPDNAAAHLQLALLLDSERHLGSAIKEYKEYIRLSPNNAEITKIKNRVLFLEQQLRAHPADSSSQAPGIAPTNAAQDTQDSDSDPEYTSKSSSKTSQSASSKTKNKPRKSDSAKPGKKIDVLEPSNGKESGF